MDNKLIQVIIEEVIDDLYRQQKNICNCSVCRNWLLEELLNKISSRYYKNSEDTIYARVQSIDLQIKAEASREIAHLIVQLPRCK